jgi:uncharacterized membrane protein YfcA
LDRVKELGPVQAFLAERQAERENWQRKPLLIKILIVLAIALIIGCFVLWRFAALRELGAFGVAVGFLPILFLLLMWLRGANNPSGERGRRLR